MGSPYTASSLSQQLIKTCIDPDGWGRLQHGTTVRGSSVLCAGGLDDVHASVLACEKLCGFFWTGWGGILKQPAGAVSE